MTRSLLIVALAGAAVLPACLRAPYEKDPKEVADRYGYRYDETCSSWLTSYKTGFEYCASPAVKVGAAAMAAAGTGDAGSTATAGPTRTDGETDLDSLREHGEQVYANVCQACHQANGQGLAAVFPPLAGSGAFYGDAQNHARLIVGGQSGQITVQGVTYNGVMPPQGHLSDYDIAAVATFERTSWGNDDGVVLPSDVAAVR